MEGSEGRGEGSGWKGGGGEGIGYLPAVHPLHCEAPSLVPDTLHWFRLLFFPITNLLITSLSPFFR